MEKSENWGVRRENPRCPPQGCGRCPVGTGSPPWSPVPSPRKAALVGSSYWMPAVCLVLCSPCTTAEATEGVLRGGWWSGHLCPGGPDPEAGYPSPEDVGG